MVTENAQIAIDTPAVRGDGAVESPEDGEIEETTDETADIIAANDTPPMDLQLIAEAMAKDFTA